MFLLLGVVSVIAIAKPRPEVVEFGYNEEDKFIDYGEEVEDQEEEVKDISDDQSGEDDADGPLRQEVSSAINFKFGLCKCTSSRL